MCVGGGGGLPPPLPLGSATVSLVPRHPPQIPHANKPGYGPVYKGLGMSSRVCATGHIKDPVPLIEKSRASCPSGSPLVSFIK